MENQKKPRLIRLSRTPKTNPRKNFCSKSLSTMGAKLVVFQPFTVQKVETLQILRPQQTQTWNKNSLGFLESLINRGHPLLLPILWTVLGSSYSPAYTIECTRVTLYSCLYQGHPLLLPILQPVIGSPYSPACTRVHNFACTCTSSEGQVHNFACISTSPQGQGHCLVIVPKDLLVWPKCPKCHMCPGKISCVKM